MKQLVIVLLLVLAGWQGYRAYQERFAGNVEHRGVADSAPSPPSATGSGDAATSGQFRCDGRTRCSQMTSCAEASFFLKNCPGVQVEGDDGGSLCWLQWCNR